MRFKGGGLLMPTRRNPALLGLLAKSVTSLRPKSTVFAEITRKINSLEIKRDLCTGILLTHQWHHRRNANAYDNRNPCAVLCQRGHLFRRHSSPRLALKAVPWYLIPPAANLAMINEQLLWQKKMHAPKKNVISRDKRRRKTSKHATKHNTQLLTKRQKTTDHRPPRSTKTSVYPVYLKIEFYAQNS